MNIHTLQLGFFIALIAGALALNFFVFLPYISIIFLAGILAIIFDPIHRRILALFRGQETLTAFVSVVVVLVFILTPLTIFGILLFQESSDVYARVSSGDSDIVGMANRGLDATQEFIQKIVPQFTVDLRSYVNVEQYAGRTLSWLSGHLAVFFGSVVKGVIGFFLMILALFYFFRDGRRFLVSVTGFSPLFDIYDGKIIQKIKIAVNSVIRGQLMIAVLQGILTGVGFALFNVPNPMIWATVAAVASLVPTLGTGLVLVPALVFLFLTHNIPSLIGLLIWGIVAVGLVDNILGPILIKRGVHIHPFIILISVLGGIALFGPVGFVAGPVVLSLLFALLDLYPVIMRSSRDQ